MSKVLASLPSASARHLLAPLGEQCGVEFVDQRVGVWPQVAVIGL
ncbi:hypothetical protein [Nonomuraea sp. B1E8]